MNSNDFLSARPRASRSESRSESRNHTVASSQERDASVSKHRRAVPNIAEATLPLYPNVARPEDIQKWTRLQPSRVFAKPYVAEVRHPITDERFSFAPTRQEPRQEPRPRRRERAQHSNIGSSSSNNRIVQGRADEPTWADILGVERREQFVADPRFANIHDPGNLQQIDVMHARDISFNLGLPHQRCVMDTVRHRNGCGGFVSTQIAGALAAEHISLPHHPLLSANEDTEMRVALLREQQGAQGLVGLRYNEPADTE